MLTGWTTSRRVVVLRRPLTGDALLVDESHQLGLAYTESEEPVKCYESAVRVTDLPHGVLTLAELYRDRADSENAVDELKNQWGWGEFTTQDITRCRLSAMGVALAYNWWSLFVRLANPTARLEAITSGMARKTRHAGQQHLTIAPMHGNGAQGMGLLTQVSQLDEGTNTHCGAIALKSV